jgi:hypothetical protein
MRGSWTTDMSTKKELAAFLRHFALVALAICALFARPVVKTAAAHNGKNHIEGTVSSIEKRKLVVSLQNGRRVSIRLRDETSYRRQESGAPASAADLSIGCHVFIESFGMHGAEQHALEVFIAKPAEAPSHPAVEQGGSNE